MLTVFTIKTIKDTAFATMIHHIMICNLLNFYQKEAIFTFWNNESIANFKLFHFLSFYNLNSPLPLSA